MSAEKSRWRKHQEEVNAITSDQFSAKCEDCGHAMVPRDKEEDIYAVLFTFMCVYCEATGTVERRPEHSATKASPLTKYHGAAKRREAEQ